MLFLEHKHLYRQTYNKSAYPGPNFMIPFGKAKVVREGTDVTVVTYGATVRRALMAANAVADGGISVEVIDLRTLSPWDRETVFAFAMRPPKADMRGCQLDAHAPSGNATAASNSRVIVAYEDSPSWGFGAEISAAIADECFAWLDAPVKRVASADTFVGYAPSLEDAILPQIEDFRHAYEEIMKF